MKEEEEELMLTLVKWDLDFLHKHFFDMNSHATM